jgi:hypothetical protein
VDNALDPVPPCAAPNVLITGAGVEMHRALEPYRDLWAQWLDELDTEIARGRRARASGEPT